MIKKNKMNAIIKVMAKNQNSKHKLNAGQLREAVTLFLNAAVELSTQGEESAMKKTATKKVAKKTVTKKK